MDPLQPKTDRRVVELEGGGWRIHEWSPDGKKLLAGEFISANESYLWLIDVATGEKMLVTPKDEPEKSSYDAARFDADGRALYVTTDRGGEFHRLAPPDIPKHAQFFITHHIPLGPEQFVLSHHH